MSKKRTIYFDQPGIQRMGPYRRETAYEVGDGEGRIPRKEAERLLRVKGWKEGSPRKAEREASKEAPATEGQAARDSEEAEDK